MGRDLAAVIATVVAAQVGVAEGIDVGTTRAKVGIVAGAVMVGSGGAGCVGEAAIDGVSAVSTAGFKAVVVRELD